MTSYQYITSDVLEKNILGLLLNSRDIKHLINIIYIWWSWLKFCLQTKMTSSSSFLCTSTYIKINTIYVLVSRQDLYRNMPKMKTVPSACPKQVARLSQN